MKSVVPIIAAIVASILLSQVTYASDLKQTAESSEALFLEAQRALAMGDYDSAEGFLTRALWKDSTFAAAAWQLAQIHESRGSIKKAIEFLRHGLAIDPANTWARKKLLQLENQVGQMNRSFAGAPVTGKEKDPAKPVTKVSEPPSTRIENSPEAPEAGRIPDKRVPATKSAEPKPEAIVEANRVDSPSIEAGAEVAKLPGPSSTQFEKIEAQGKQEQKTSKSNLWLALLSSIPPAVAIFLYLWGRSLSRSRNYPLKGSLAVLPLLDVVSMLASNARSGVLTIESKECSGRIFMERGNVIHALCENSLSKAAFARLLKVRSGQFYFTNHLPPVRHSITEPLGFLLLLATGTDPETHEGKSDLGRKELTCSRASS